MKTLVPSTKKSLPSQSLNGGPPPPLVPAVVPPAILTDLPCSNETVLCLTAMLTGMMSEMLSPDAMHLAMIRAKNEAVTAGVSEEEFGRVLKIVEKHWDVRRRRNPLSCLF